MAVGDDFKVSRRYRDEVAEIAKKWRTAAPSSASSNHFDVVRFLQEIVLPELHRQGRVVELHVVEDEVDEPLASVNVSTGELRVQNWIWQLALEQSAKGRLVIAHEIGHLVLHGEQVHAFSMGAEKKLGFLDPADSAECQANWFASTLLLPDEVLRKLAHLSDAAVATLTLTSERVVQVRRQELALVKGHLGYTGDACSRCGSLRVILVGSSLRCESCGKTEPFAYTAEAID